jgi:hypothetical protein
MSDEVSLTAAERELETALRSLQPTPARIDLTTALAAGRCMAKGRTAARRERYWPMAAAAAALLAVVGAWWAIHSSPSPTNFTAPQRHIVAVPLSGGPPTMLDYRQALAQSPEALNDLLDRQAIAGNATSREVMPVGMATVWNANLYSEVGEM